MGNLASVTDPNGVVETYTYDAKNRLTNLAAAGGNGANATNLSYAYTLDNAGQRTSVTEASGRKVTYGYDNLYRLTNETIAGDQNGNSGSIGYSYDAVGNRTQQSSTSPAITSGAFGYDADDRLTGDVYDANGNTISTGGQGITYDFENHILTENGATYAYDGDGNRVRKTVGGITTSYAITSVATSVNPEGLPLVGYEGITGFGTHDSYRYWVLGLRREAQFRQPSSGAVEKSYYVYDGHGSARALTDPSGNVTDTYDYDAFGNLIHSATTLTSPTPNEFLFAGEQYDTETGHYYNRARYLNTSTGRFITMDTFEGDLGSPASLHKYLYASADPVDRIDPTGNQDDIATEEVAEEGEEVIEAGTMLQPEVAVQAQSAAQTAAVSAQIDNSLVGTVLLWATIGAFTAALAGDNGPSRHSGRLQVQGTDILENGVGSLAGHPDFNLARDTLSWPWNLSSPLLAQLALTKLSEFLQILTFEESGRRKNAFVKASTFIANASLAGGVWAPTRISLKGNDARYPDARIDIEVQSGAAFIPGP